MSRLRSRNRVSERFRSSGVRGYVIVGWHPTRLFAAHRRLPRPHTGVGGLAMEQLEYLRYSTTMQGKLKTGFKLNKLSLEGGDQVTRTGREISHGESV